MIKSLVISLAKKYAVGAVRDAVSAKKDDVARWAKRIAGWIVYVQSVLAFLMSLADKLADGELTDEEAKSAIDEAGKLAAEFAK